MITSREQIATLLHDMGLVGDGLELGVGAGTFSDIILSAWSGQHLWLVDPLLPMWDYHEPESNSSERHQLARDLLADLLEQHHPRAIWLPLRSYEALPHFQNHYLDFVYIDANHSFTHAHFDIESWWEKVKPGGLFCGHDYLNQKDDTHDCQVKSAVDQFIQRLAFEGILPELTTTSCTSWWIVKPK